MEQISKETKGMMKQALGIAKSTNDIHLRPEHMTLAIIGENDPFIVDLLTELGVDMGDLETDILQHSNDNLTPRLDNDPNFIIEPNLTTKSVMAQANAEAKDNGDDEVNNIHVLLALATIPTITKTTLNAFGVEYEHIKRSVNPTSELGENYSDVDGEDIFQETIDESESKTPVLDSFGVDLTAKARAGELDPVVGRAKEIERITQILSRKKKNNPILIGEPGVGKSAIAEAIAQKIVSNEISIKLLGKKIFTLELASVVAGTKYRGQFEERMKAIINELKRNKDVVIFIDEIHTIVGAGNSAGSMDASNMLKPALASGEIQIIGATTFDEYRESMEKDGALARRFQEVIVNPTTPEETLEILTNVRSRYEEHHSCKYSDESLAMCVKLADRYITTRHMPDSALDVMDEAGASTHTKVTLPKTILDLVKKKAMVIQEKQNVVVKGEYEKAGDLRVKEKELTVEIETKKSKWYQKVSNKITNVSVDTITQVTSKITGIPLDKVSANDLENLSKMGAILKSNVIGQDQSIDIIAKSIRRARHGMQDKNAPMGSYIITGISGSGKTLLAKKIAEIIFGSSDKLIRLDMSEYQDSFNVTKLIGAPPGYVGHEEGGKLTEKVRKNPHSLILFDEIEKAHPDIFKTMLQILDEGHITDSLGRKVNFKNTLIIMTSNIGISEVAKVNKDVGFGNAQNTGEQEKRVVAATFQKELKDKFPPEFLNRISEIITFNTLSRDDIRKIVDIEVEQAIEDIKGIDFDITVDVSTKLRDKIAKDGYSTEYGARPLKRVIMSLVKDKVGDLIIDKGVEPKSHISLCYNDKTKNVTHKTTKR